MAKITSLEVVPDTMRKALLGALRVSDEATVLPSACRSSETGAFKNVVMRISGSEPDLNPDCFSPDWFSGVSMVCIPREVAEPLLGNPSRRAKALRELSERIKSELADSKTQVGPELECDENDRDVKQWDAGFDTASCCVGLYSAQQSRAPEMGITGMNRVYQAYYLVCKAGGGVAAQTFHSRLCAALKAGKSLDDALERGSDPGPQALRRVSLAAQRNRRRILVAAAEVLGIHSLDTIGDNAAAAASPHRGAITTLDVTYNSLRKVEGLGDRSVWQYAACCVDAHLSQGLITCSNVAEGFISFTNSQDEFRTSMRNDAHNCLPFSTERLQTNRELATLIAKEHKKTKLSGKWKAHPDHDWIRERFAWANKESKELGPDAKKIEPVSLWGSHASERFLSSWSRELGIASCKAVRMAPEVVCLAGMEQSKLRGAVKHMNQS